MNNIKVDVQTIQLEKVFSFLKEIDYYLSNEDFDSFL